MTEKRFTLTYEKLGKYFSMGIVDHKTKEPFDDTTYEFHQCSFKDSKDEMEDLCLLLNELHEENIMLKERRHEDINELSVIAMKYKALEKENEKLKFENNELKCALALDEVEYIIADGKKIDIPPYYEFEQRYDSVMHRREYDGYD